MKARSMACAIPTRRRAGWRGLASTSSNVAACRVLVVVGITLLGAVGPVRVFAHERAGARRGEHRSAARLLVAAVPAHQSAAAQVGTISGRVTEALSGVGVAGATVLLEGTSFGAVTGNTGRYEISDVPAGSYTLVAQQPGYRDARRSVTVADEQVATVDVALDVSALPMDEIVATGTAFSTRVRTLPNPISVITAREIEQKQSTNVTDLLRGEVPGLMALSGGQDDETSQLFVRGNAAGLSPDHIKTYIDGVEVAHPTLLSTIDPKSIERVEVVRGPQASAIYGSEAASGVLQIITKKGTPGLARPRLRLQASAGVVESDYTPPEAGTPLTQDYSVEVSGGGESFSYRVGGSYVTVGEWVKHYGSKTLGLSGGLRAVHGPVTAELTALWSDRDYDYGNSPVYLRWPTTSECPRCGNPDYQDNWDWALSQNTIALTLGYRATDRWRHTLTLGDDQNRSGFHQPEPSYNTPADTFVRLQGSEFRRRSVRYHTAYDAELGARMTGRFTGGIEYWSYDVQGRGATNLLNAFGTIQPSANTSYWVTNDGWWNAGYFAMAELGFADELYLTGAVRVEDNPNLGEEYGRAVTPRVGASWVRRLGGAEVKLRAQWGKGVRPPPTYARTGYPPSATVVYLPNPEIAPEEKAGWDAGVDVYWGSRASLSLTRYEEEAKNLIYRETIDATAVPEVRQYRNVGLVGLEGWEVEGRLNVGPVTLSANYAYSDNVVEKVDSATAADPNALLKVGDRPTWVAKHSGGWRLSARVGRGTVSIDGSVMEGWRSIDYVAYLGWLRAGEPYRGSIRAYFVEYPALWKWNLRTDQALTERMTAFLRVDNLANNQDADLYNLNVTPGRTTVLGLRFTH